MQPSLGAALGVVNVQITPPFTSVVS